MFQIVIRTSGLLLGVKKITTFSLYVTVFYIQWQSITVKSADTSLAKVIGVMEKTDNPFMTVLEHDEAKTRLALHVKKAISNRETLRELYVLMSVRTEPNAKFELVFFDSLCYLLQGIENFLPTEIIDMIFAKQRGHCNIKKGDFAIRTTGQVHADRQNVDNTLFPKKTPYELEVKILDNEQLARLGADVEDEILEPLHAYNVTFTGAMQKTDNQFMTAVEDDNYKSGWAVNVKRIISDEENKKQLYLIFFARTDPKKKLRDAFFTELCALLENHYNEDFLPKQIVGMIFTKQKGSCHFEEGIYPIRAAALVYADPAKHYLHDFPRTTPYELEVRLIEEEQFKQIGHYYDISEEADNVIRVTRQLHTNPGEHRERGIKAIDAGYLFKVNFHIEGDVYNKTS